MKTQKFVLGLLALLLSQVGLGDCQTRGSYEHFNKSWNLLPDCEEAKEFYQYSINVAEALKKGDSALEMEFSKGGGTSIYVKIKYKGKYGAWLPRNSATQIEGEIFSYNLSRALEIDNVGHGIEMPIQGRGFEQFSRIISRLNCSKFNKWKAKNCNSVKAQLQKAGATKSLQGVYKLWGPKPFDLDELVLYSSGPNGTFKTSHKLAKILAGQVNTGDMSRVYSLAGSRIKDTGMNLGRDLSNIFVIDALNGQWDRFSGGNISGIKEGSTGRIVSYDNGGTQNSDCRKYRSHLSCHYLRQFPKWVKVFDPKVAQNVIAMDNFLKVGGNYKGISSQEKLAKSLGVRFENTRWKKRWGAFKYALTTVRNHIEASNRFFEVDDQPKTFRLKDGVEQSVLKYTSEQSSASSNLGKTCVVDSQVVLNPPFSYDGQHLRGTLVSPNLHDCYLNGKKAWIYLPHWAAK